MSALSLHVKRPIIGVDGGTARTAHSHQHAEIKEALVPVFPDLGQTRDIISNQILRACHISIDRRNLYADFVVLNMQDFDIILGID